MLSRILTASLSLGLATLPAASQSLPEAARGWTVTLGGTVTAVPLWMGSSRLGPMIMPRLSLRAPGAPERFSSFDDGIAPAIVDLGWLRLGPNASLVGARRASDDARLAGLAEVGFTVEAGAFAELFPVEWLRLRAAVRHGIGGHAALVGNAGADVIWRPAPRWTVSAGPRTFFGSDGYASRYFSVSAAESLASGLGPYQARGGLMKYGAVAQVSYRFDAGWTVTGFAAYDRLAGSAAAAPLVTQRGSANQVTVGSSLTYSFTLGQ
ncbi:MAG: MipA/OmpV family protein [Phreatobacter sp.]|uniref:MipA/OmpV family protein n=1 Tax=Phreatobacter sp. TaxID=1966341 RepID=UPI0040368A81